MLTPPSIDTPLYGLPLHFYKKILIPPFMTFSNINPAVKYFTSFFSISIADFEQVNVHWIAAEAVVRRCSIKKVFLEISQNSQENPCARDSF